MRLFASSTFSGRDAVRRAALIGRAPGRRIPVVGLADARRPRRAAAATKTIQRLRIRAPSSARSAPTDELPDLRRDALRLVPQQQVAGALDDLERGARNARREHPRIGDRHERVVVAADDERLVPNRRAGSSSSTSRNRRAAASRSRTSSAASGGARRSRSAASRRRAPSRRRRRPPPPARSRPSSRSAAASPSTAIALGEPQTEPSPQFVAARTSLRTRSG